MALSPVKGKLYALNQVALPGFPPVLQSLANGPATPPELHKCPKPLPAVSSPVWQDCRPVSVCELPVTQCPSASGRTSSSSILGSAQVIFDPSFITLPPLNSSAIAFPFQFPAPNSFPTVHGLFVLPRPSLVVVALQYLIEASEPRIKLYISLLVEFVEKNLLWPLGRRTRRRSVCPFLDSSSGPGRNPGRLSS